MSAGFLIKQAPSIAETFTSEFAMQLVKGKFSIYSCVFMVQCYRCAVISIIVCGMANQEK
jgi:hypothetical protein